MYDIFISYKHLDEQNHVTEDYEIAKKLYETLTNSGYSVFFSEQVLSENGTAAFKQEIDDALDSAKVLILVLTKSEYASSKWVKYEWDSFYNDYLSGIKENAYLYTLCKDVPICELPRTLRGLQSFNYHDGYEQIIKFLHSVLGNKHRYDFKSNDEICFDDIKDAVELDHIVFPNMEHVDPAECWKWFKLNPDIYLFIKDAKTNKVVAYTNTAPITDECYKLIKSGKFLTTNITDDMILTFDMPYAYNLYFFSIVIHPDHQNSEIFFMLVNGLVEKFINLSKHDVFIKRMIADAVTVSGEKFCKLFGMEKITNSLHNSKLFEVSMIPPRFKVISKAVKELFDTYKEIYIESPYLFDEDK